MRPSTNDAAFLWDMLDAAQAVASFVASRAYRDYVQDRMLRGAVERHLEILGEAAGRVSGAFREDHPEIPWRAVIGLRNVLAHDYGEIKHDKVWDVATEAIPALIVILESLVPAAPDSQQP
jgi:uncharacterized protein with HEPN domain